MNKEEWEVKLDNFQRRRKMQKQIPKILGVLLGLPLLIAGVSAGLGALFMLLWNLALTPLGAPVLGFFQAWGLWILIGLVGSIFRARK